MSKFKYQVKINGRRSINGPLFGLTINGEVDVPEGLNLMHVLTDLNEEIDDQATAERMEIREAIQIIVQKVQ